MTTLDARLDDLRERLAQIADPSLDPAERMEASNSVTAMLLSARLDTLREVRSALLAEYGVTNRAASFVSRMIDDGRAAAEAEAARLHAPVTIDPQAKPAPVSGHVDEAVTGAVVGPIVVACDGSSLSNPGNAGWAWYVDDARWAADGVQLATNNAMELSAVVAFLESTTGVLDDVETVIRCDSKYVIDGVTKWSTGWVKKGWKNSAGQPVANKELFQRILALLAPRTATRFEWVKGHAGDRLNTAADERAWGAANAVQSGTTVRTGPGW